MVEDPCPWSIRITVWEELETHQSPSWCLWHQNNEVIRREIVRWRLLDLAEKKELNRVVKAMTEVVNSTRYELHSAIRRISSLEESYRKLRATFSNAIPPP
jgi:hypothetical protein